MIIFDKNKLYDVIKGFHDLTQATISFWDSDFNQIVVYPSSHRKICRKIKENFHGNQNCFNSNKSACINSTKLSKPYIFTCHAGLIDVVVPVLYENKTIAYIMFGQIRDAEEEYVKFENVQKLCLKYGLSEEEIKKYFEEIPTLTLNQINNAANFLSMITVYLYTSQTIKIEKNMLISEIDAYITRNIKSNISVEDLCEEFKISKNNLYQIAHKYFNTSIGNYITSKRIDLAKHYLTTTQLPITAISAEVGYLDYNYFIRKFKKQTGYTPLSYRKNFPHNIL